MAPLSKRAALERLLEQGMVMVHLDARRPGVRVPQSLRAEPQLRLNLSYRFASHDLAISDEWVRCSLSFSGQVFYCELPLAAIFAVTSHVTGEALVWEDTLAGTLEPMAAAPGPLVALSGASPLREPTAGRPHEETRSQSGARAHLRLVKS